MHKVGPCSRAILEVQQLLQMLLPLMALHCIRGARYHACMALHMGRMRCQHAR